MSDGHEFDEFADLLPAISLTREARDRLRKNEAAQRAETKRRGLPVEFVSVEALWLLQQGRCCCPNCGKLPLNPAAVGQEPDAPTIAHVYLRKRGGGHTIENVRLWRFACNAEMARTERHDTALGDRMAVDLTKKNAPEDTEPKPTRKIPSRLGGGKPEGYVSALSKNHPGYRKPAWGKR